MMASVKWSASSIGNRSRGTATRGSARTVVGDHRPASCRGLRVGRDLFGAPARSDPPPRRLRRSAAHGGAWGARDLER